MKIRYFRSTDTLYIEFNDAHVAQTRELDENTLLDLGANGEIRAMTMEHASKRASITQFSYEQIEVQER